MRGRRAIFLLLMMVHVAPFTHAQDKKEKRLLMSVQTGYHSFDFNWSIAGNLQGQNPNIYSELVWKDLRGPMASASLQWNAWKQWVVYVDILYAAITWGSATDTDYESDNRVNPSFSALLKSSKGHSAAMKMGLGYYFTRNEKLQLLALAGYGMHQQHLRLMEDGGDPLKTLNSSYEPIWKGPYAGINADIAITAGWKTGGSLIYQQVNYTADANWNLVEDFAHPLSFRHTAKGYGMEAGLHLQKKLNHALSLKIQAVYFQWSTGYGIDELYKSDGQVIKTRLNDASSNGFRLGVGVAILL